MVLRTEPSPVMLAKFDWSVRALDRGSIFLDLTEDQYELLSPPKWQRRGGRK
jgi:hypothetical protein